MYTTTAVDIQYQYHKNTYFSCIKFLLKTHTWKFTEYHPCMYSMVHVEHGLFYYEVNVDAQV